MSSNNNGRPGHLKPSQRPSTFVSRPDVRCPSCEDEGRLDALGLPRLIHRLPLRPQSRELKRGATTSFGCETCGGTGRVPFTQEMRPGCKSNDPMEIPVKG